MLARIVMENQSHVPVKYHIPPLDHPGLETIERALRLKVTQGSRLQEVSETSASNGEESSTGLSSSAGELGWRRLGAGGSSGSNGVGGDGSVLGWVGNNRGRSGDGAGLDGNTGAGLARDGSGLDGHSGGVLAVVIDDGGAAGDGVGLGADLEGGGLSADGAQTLDGGGGVAGVLDSGAGRVGSGGGSWVSVVSSWGGGSVDGSGAGLVDSRVSAIGVGVGGGSKASEDGEGAHVDCLGLIIKYVGIKYRRSRENE
jgi:hypothetical protein